MIYCPLCKNETETLIDSHLIPRAAYRLILEGSAPAKNFIRINIGDNDAFFTSKQISTHFLCESCEDLISKNCETQLGLLWATSSSFPLLEKMQHTKPITTDCYDASCLTEKDRDALIYFAVSMLWKANIWPTKIENYQGSLGNKYSEEFRLFLQNQSPLSKFKLIININSNPEPGLNLTASLPGLVINNLGKIHVFSILGITFNIILGKTTAEIERAFSHLPHKILFLVDDIKQSNIFNVMAKKIKYDIKKRGKLAKNLTRNFGLM